MAIPECLNDEDEAAHCVNEVAHILVEPLVQQPEITIQQADLNKGSSESVVNNSAPEEQERADSPSEVELEIHITDAYRIGKNEEAISTSSHKLPSAESQGTDALLGFPLHRNSLIPITSDSDQTPPDSTQEPHNVENVLSPALVTDTSDQSGRKCILKDIFLEYALPHSLGDVLTLNVRHDDGSDQLRLSRTSNTRWKAVENIEYHQNSGNIMLVASSMERGDEGFLTLTEDEMYAMAYVKEDTPVEHIIMSAREGYQMHIKISAPIVSCDTRIQSGECMSEMQLRWVAILEATRRIPELQIRFGQTKDIKDINQVILLWEEVICLSSGLPGFEHNHLIECVLGSAYLNRFKCTDDLDDADRAISHHQNAVEGTPSGHADLPERLNYLGNSYFQRFKRAGNLADIDYAIAHHQKAVEGTPSGHVDLPARLNDLRNSYLRRFNHTRDFADINCAISHHQKAVDSIPSGHADLSARLTNLGISYALRYERTGNLADIDYAISHHQKAVDSTPSGHADLPARLTNLGISYSLRFERTGDLTDIDYAISHQQNAVEGTPSGHAYLPARLGNLGSSYLRRYDRTGDLTDIDYAISHHQKAVDFTPSGHADRPGRLSNLGSSYFRRFERTGDSADMDCAISHHQKAVDSTPSGHADRPGRLSNLGGSYFRRFERTVDLADIDYAISHHQNALECNPSGHADLLVILNNLGTSYFRRFNHTRDFADINCAISHFQKAVDSSPSGHPRLLGRLTNLGSSYSARFERTGDLADIDYAISHHQKAVDSTPSGHAGLPMLLACLGNSYSTRFSRNNNKIDIQRAIILYRRSVQSNGLPSVRLRAAQLAARYSFLHDTPGCLLDFTLVIQMLYEVAGFEQTINQRYDNLFDHSNFVGAAVSVAILQSKPDLALEWLEQGRCLVWNQLNQLRTPIYSLRNIYPSLADQFISIASALEFYGSRSVIPKRTSSLDLTDEIRLQNDAQKHTLVAIQYNELLNKIRALPDFGDFLRPPKATNILSLLPTDGPVIVFNIHELRCDALALISGIEDPLLIPLGNFSLDKAKKLLKTLRFDILKNREVDNQDQRLPQRVKSSPASMSYVLKELWYNVVQPVLEALGYSFGLSGRRRIWWCPSGPLAFLPLHAAGIYGLEYKPGSCISDYAVSSYTPTVQSLNEKISASSASPREPNILVINPNTPGLRPIPYTAIESHGIKELFGESALLLEDAAATTDTVKNELKAHNWVHFACHGIQDAQDPLKSGVHLFDGRLELLDIMHQKLSNADFAFLSACQTGKGDAKLSEEVVHIAAGMLAAGYHGVVGTMWSISDRHGPQFAKHFYDYLFKEKVSEWLDSTKAAYALDYATRKVRETLGEGDDTFLIWVPYIHFGY